VYGPVAINAKVAEIPVSDSTAVNRGKKVRNFYKADKAATECLYTGCERRGTEQADKEFVKQLFLRMKKSARRRASIDRMPQL
jgi:hypothetical protein